MNKEKNKSKPANSSIPKNKSESQPLPSRQLKKPEYKTFRLSKRIKHPVALPTSFRIFIRSYRLLRGHWKVLGGITFVYALLNYIFVRGMTSALDLQFVKGTIESTLQETANQFSTGLALLSVLIQSSGRSTDLAGSMYQFILVIVTSLALIWALRQLQAKSKIGIRDAFYKGMYPLVPFLLVLGVVFLQLIPLIAANFIFGIVQTNNIAVTVLEQVIWTLMLGLLALISIYMVCSSVFALYIVTLPEMTPMRALRSARQLVLNRRWTVMRKVIFLPIILLVVIAAVMIPLIMFATPVAEIFYFLLTMFGLAFVHTYMYLLYRELL